MDISDMYHLKLDEESYLLTRMYKKWQNVLDSEKNIQQEMEDEIRRAVGQTKLLVNEKLKQFKDLLRKFEKGEGDGNITPNDLEGFWDLVMIQVNEVKKHFSELENWKKSKKKLNC